MGALKFYLTPGSCTTGIHILLEELELVFEVYIVNLLAGDQNALISGDKPQSYYSYPGTRRRHGSD